MYPYLRFFTRTNEFIDEAVSRRGTVVVNCVMGWSRSATVVAAYLMSKKAHTHGFHSTLKSNDI